MFLRTELDYSFCFQAPPTGAGEVRLLYPNLPVVHVNEGSVSCSGANGDLRCKGELVSGDPLQVIRMFRSESSLEALL